MRIFDDGEHKLYYDNGQIRSLGTAKDNALHGVCKEWYENGQQHVLSNFKNNNLHGVYKKWTYSGRLCKHCIYQHDKMVCDLKGKSKEDIFRLMLEYV